METPVELLISKRHIKGLFRIDTPRTRIKESAMATTTTETTTATTTERPVVSEADPQRNKSKPKK